MRRISVTESVQRDQGHRMLAASQQSAVMSDRIKVLERDNMRLRAITMPTATRIGMTPAAIEEMIKRCMEEALEAYRNREPIRENGDGHGDDNGNDNRNGNGDGGENGNGNGLGGGNGNGNHNVNVGGVVPAARECTYQDFLKFHPLTFKENEGVVGLTRWFEKMETVFHISNCPPKYQVK
ncbi:hypothetical protein Tco_0489055 [Tanacetum coccineum]